MFYILIGKKKKTQNMQRFLKCNNTQQTNTNKLHTHAKEKKNAYLNRNFSLSTPVFSS